MRKWESQLQDYVSFSRSLLSSGISSEGGWAGLLFLLAVHGQGHLRPGVEREGEGGTNVEGEVDFHALAGQRLAEIQALDGQRGVSFIHSSHFGVLLN